MRICPPGVTDTCMRRSVVEVAHLLTPATFTMATGVEAAVSSMPAQMIRLPARPPIGIRPRPLKLINGSPTPGPVPAATMTPLEPSPALFTRMMPGAGTATVSRSSAASSTGALAHAPTGRHGSSPSWRNWPCCRRCPARRCCRRTGELKAYYAVAPHGLGPGQLESVEDGFGRPADPGVLRPGADTGRGQSHQHANDPDHDQNFDQGHTALGGLRQQHVSMPRPGR